MSSLDIASIFNIPKLPSYLERVNQELASVTISGSPSINKPLSRLLKSQGKRLRPTLLIAVALSQGVEIDETIISACVAVELLHIGSLVHDDIIDNASTRWDKPTINSVEGNNDAIIIGDFLLAKACAVGAKISGDIGEKIALTITELCDGESRELADQYKLSRTKESYLRAVEGKTAALISAACVIGGMCAKLDSSKLSLLDAYGRNFGVSFQLMDDLVDLLSTPEILGKSVGSDIKEGVYTIPLIYSLSGPYKDVVEECLSNKDGAKVSEIIDIILKDSSVERTISLARKYNQLAVDSLYKMEESNLMNNLVNLPDNYLSWSLRNLIAKTYLPSISNLS